MLAAPAACSLPARVVCDFWGKKMMRGTDLTAGKQRSWRTGCDRPVGLAPVDRRLVPRFGESPRQCWPRTRAFLLFLLLAIRVVPSAAGQLLAPARYLVPAGAPPAASIPPYTSVARACPLRRHPSSRGLPASRRRRLVHCFATATASLSSASPAAVSILVSPSPRATST